MSSLIMCLILADSLSLMMLSAAALSGETRCRYLRTRRSLT